MRFLLFLCISWFCIVACQAQEKPSQDKTNKVAKTNQEWQKCLSAEQYKVLRQKGTEMAFTGKFYDHHEEGTYICVGCKNNLFTSDTKFDSGTGWPSYFKPFSQKSIKTNQDSSHGMDRQEVVCGKCDGHLGHVFDDGPKPTGLRYCINSAALDFVPKKK